MGIAHLLALRIGPATPHVESPSARLALARAGFFFVESGWIAGALAVVAIGCLLTFIMLSIARLQRPDETPAQTARRLEETAGEFDQDP